jgi:hypothetical protein
MNTLPVAIIGAGPVGLAAAAHLIERGETPLVLEAGAAVGASVMQWAHVRMFSPWEYTVDSATVRLLEASGWAMPPKDALPTGEELVRDYLAPFAALPAVRDHIRLSTRVLAVSRRDADKMKDAGRQDSPFVLHVAHADGTEYHIEARAVIDASGTWTQPNPLGANGLPAAGERASAERIIYGIPDVTGSARGRYANRRVLVVGSGHSAVNALLELAQLHADALDTRILWAMRGTSLARVYGGGEADALAARGRLGTRLRAHVDAGLIEIVSPFRVRRIAVLADGAQVTGDTPAGPRTLMVDEIIGAAGARPDLGMLGELRLDIDPTVESTRALAPLIDPNIHSCGTVRPHGEAELRQPEKDFYIVGMKSYGRAPTFLLATGYEQVRSVAAALAGDWEAARDVQLSLPETGVCSTDLLEGGSCCAPAAQAQPALVNLAAVGVSTVPLTSMLIQPIAVDAAACCNGEDDCC